MTGPAYRGFTRVIVLTGTFSLVPALVAEAAPQNERPRRNRARKARARPEPPPPAQTPQFRGPTRIDFDDRLIQGQTNKSGAVYLFDRKETGILSMVRRRKSFRYLTIETIYDR